MIQRLIALNLLLIPCYRKYYGMKVTNTFITKENSVRTKNGNTNLIVRMVKMIQMRTVIVNIVSLITLQVLPSFVRRFLLSIYSWVSLVSSAHQLSHPVKYLYMTRILFWETTSVGNCPVKWGGGEKSPNDLESKLE